MATSPLLILIGLFFLLPSSALCLGPGGFFVRFPRFSLESRGGEPGGVGLSEIGSFCWRLLGFPLFSGFPKNLLPFLGLGGLASSTFLKFGAFSGVCAWFSLVFFGCSWFWALGLGPCVVLRGSVLAFSLPFCLGVNLV